MSFWKRTLLGRDEASTELPTGDATSPKNDSPAPPPATEAAAVGPPPIATAYTHSSKPLERESPKQKQHEAPPTFQIFEPHPETKPEEDSITEAAAADADGVKIVDCDSVDEDSARSDVDPDVNQKQDSNKAYDGAKVHDSENESFENDASTTDNYALHSEEAMTMQAPFQNNDMDGPEPLRIDTRVEESGQVTPADTADDGNGGEPTPNEIPLTPLYTEQETALVVGQTEEEGTPLSPKFDFLNESVPLQELQDSTSKRRHVALIRIHELDCKLASLQAKLAHESMDRAAALRMSTLDNVVTRPLEETVERFGNTLLLPPDGPLHSRLTKLEVARMRHLHVELPDAVADELQSPHEYVRQELQASLRLESSKAEKRIGSMVRRFEAIAGTVARRHQEEAASRRAALLQVQALTQDAADLDERRALQFLQSLRELRESLERERQERKVRDEEVMSLIVERMTELKRALLEAAGSTN